MPSRRFGGTAHAGHVAVGVIEGVGAPIDQIGLLEVEERRAQ